MEILNLYAGIGGNRKLWGDVDVVAIESNKEIAKIYSDNFPFDTVIVTDAHKYLLEYYKNFDFIWSSPPCPSHSKLRKGFSISNKAKPIYPDMKLYQEIIFLEGYFKGKWVVENVIGWYNPLVKPYELNRHYFWCNFILSNKRVESGKLNLTGGWEKQDDELQIKQLEKEFDYDLSKYNLSKVNRRTILRNCVNPKLGLHIFNCAFKIKQETLKGGSFYSSPSR